MYLPSKYIVISKQLQRTPNEKYTITFVPLILQLREMHFRSLINQQLFAGRAETYFPQISGVHARFFVDIHLISPHHTAASYR